MLPVRYVSLEVTIAQREALPSYEIYRQERTRGINC